MKSATTRALFNLLMVAAAFVSAPSLLAQSGSVDQNAPTQDANQEAPRNPNEEMPVFRVNVSEHTTKAVNYRNRGGSTEVDFRGTDLMPDIKGKAKVEAKNGRLSIELELNRLSPANRFGGQFLTFVLWAITPEGRAVNLGEVLPQEDGKNRVTVTTQLQAFGMILTAEPYYSVTYPSNKVVAENIVRSSTKGFEQPIDTRFDVLEGGQYTIDVPGDQLPSSTASVKVPLDLLEARNAVAIAKAAGAQQYAADSLAKAQEMLDRAEDYYTRKQGKTPIGTAARGATQMAEDARVLTLRRKQQAKIEAERRARQEAQEKAEAEAAAAEQQSAEDARRRADAERAEAEARQQQAEAQSQQQQAMAQQQQAEAAKQAALQAADQAERQRQEAVRQREAMRARLLAQLNQVLQTRDTARGLIVSMPDVLFDFNKYTLKSEARERLARISGIVLAYPDLKMEIDGYTDSVGSDEYNQTLSEKRAASVRDYLVTSGVSMNSVVARGLGKADPVADNTTAAGRQKNRRVEMIVSGDVIGDQSSPGSVGNQDQSPSTPQQ